MKTEEFDLSKKHKGLYTFFIILMFIGVILIFLNSIYDAQGNSWLEIVLFFIITEWTGAVFTSILFLIIVILAMWFVMKEKKEKKESG